MQEKLFLNDSYLKECMSNLVDVTDTGGLIFDKTIFYAMSGGQPGDEGLISWGNKSCRIKNTIKNRDGDVCLVTDDHQEIPTIGSKCIQELNWTKRLKYMRVHTALHLLSVIIPLPVTGGQISEDKGRLDFNMPEPIQNKEELENKLNEIIANEYTVSDSWITEEELDKKPELVKTMSVSPPRGAGKIRLIRIGDRDQIDLQPCGGTHVRTTGEIGKVSIGKIENKGKQNRRVNLYIL